ncbi:TetR/AcrR family transcriptional regulator [Streptomyces albidoflavus]|uniref:TetR/AcrR family transcriptional regulator n=1 Tax=Streptomyces albidoflavus TaxID=1886 RepID=UPI0020D2412B|nr:TetR/AcrR family transcriptional regulator [Streptomyces albidoflavus]
MDSTEETPAATPDAPLGLRERKKAATRQAVHEAAMRLTREHGLDHVTVEAIADAAGISRRTFSNYFAGKEDALLYGKEQYIQRLLDAVRDRPAEESNWQALRAATQVLEYAADEERQGGEPGRAVRTRPGAIVFGRASPGGPGSRHDRVRQGRVGPVPAPWRGRSSPPTTSCRRAEPARGRAPHQAGAGPGPVPGNGTPLSCDPLAGPLTWNAARTAAAPLAAVSGVTE